MVQLRRRQAFNSCSCQTVSPCSREECSYQQPSSYLCFHFSVCLKNCLWPIIFYIRSLQSFKIKFPLRGFLVHVLNSANINPFRRMREYLHVFFFYKVQFQLQISNLMAFENNTYTAHDHFHGNGAYGKILAKKEAITTFGFTSIFYQFSCLCQLQFCPEINNSISSRVFVVRYTHNKAQNSK